MLVTGYLPNLPQDAHIWSLTLLGDQLQLTDTFTYPMGTSGGGPTGICVLYDSPSNQTWAVWGDQSTQAVHRALISDNGSLVQHDPVFMIGMADPLGVYCDSHSTTVFVVNKLSSAAGTPTSEVRARSLASPTVSTIQVQLELRGVSKLGDDELALAASSGVYRMPVTGPVAGGAPELVVRADTTVEALCVDASGVPPELVVTTYGYSGRNLLRAPLLPGLNGTSSILKPIEGAKIDPGSGSFWGLALAPNHEVFWVALLGNSTSSMSFEILRSSPVANRTGSVYKPQPTEAYIANGIAISPHWSDAPQRTASGVRASAS